MSSLEEEVLKEMFQPNSSVTMVKYMTGTKRRKEYLEIWKIYLAIKLLTPLNIFIKNLSPPPPPLANLK